MATASLVGFVKTLLIILMVLMGIRLIMRLVAPFLMRFFLTKVSERVQRDFERAQRQQDFYNSASKAANDHTQTIYNEKTSSKNPQATKKVGEYIDYEEV